MQVASLMMQSPLQHVPRGLQFLPGGVVQGPSSVWSRGLGDELQSLCEGGQLDRAIDVLFCMDQKGSVPSVNIYRSLLKACTKRKALTQAKRVHAHLAQHGLESAKLLGEDVVSTLVKCGALEDALQVFYRLPHRNVFCWTAAISGHVNAGQGREALRMYQSMQKEGVQPNAYTFVSLLKACGSIASLEEAKRIHADVVRHGYGSDLFVGTCMVDMYRKCGSIGDAEDVFNGLSKRDVVVWTTMLMAYLEQGKPEKAVEMYEQMQVDGVSPNDRTFVSVVQACRMLAENEKEILIHGRPTKVLSLEKGRALHADACRKAYASDVFVGSSLISMYGKCGSIEDALNAFDSILHRDVVSWNAMLAAYVEQGHAEKALQLYERMLHEGLSPDAWTFVGALQACGMVADKEEGVILDGQAIKVNSLEKGRAIHADVCKKACSSDVFVCNALLSLYGKCGKIVDAQNLFDGLSRRDVVSWNAMLSAYVQHGQGEKALELYNQMQEGSVSPDGRTFVSTVQACSMLAAQEQDAKVDGQSIKVKSLKVGEAIHADICRKGYNSDAFVGNTLIDMYGKCGSVVHAQTVFSGLSQRDLVSWNLMLAIYVEHGQSIVALQLYEQMQAEGCSPDNRSFVCAMQACSVLAEEEGPVWVDGRFTKLRALEKGRAIHAAVCVKGYESDAFTGCTLIKMYRKCGSIADAQKVFDGFSQRNVVAWNLMLAAYVEEGQPEKVLELYQQMQDEGMDPDNRTFVSMLQASGMLMGKKADKLVAGSTKLQSLELGEAIHAEVLRKGYETDVYVGNTLVSMYGKCGNIVSAQVVFDGLCLRDVVTWNALLTAYIEQGQAEKVLQLYEQIRYEGISPNSRVFVSTLQACCMLAEKEQVVMVDEQPIRVKSLAMGKALHADIRRKSLDSDVFVSNVLVSTYRRCGSTSDAWNVFYRLSERDVVSWNAMLAAYVEQGEAENALRLYEEMQEEGASPDNRTFVSAVQACGMLADREETVLVDRWPRKIKSLNMGAAIHAHTWGKGYASNVFVGNTLVSMYGKCGSISGAQIVFHELSQRDVVSWNAMLAAYVEQGEADQAVRLYEQMVEEEWVSPDNRTLVSTLQACGMLADKEETVLVDGRPTKVHCLVRGRALHSKICNMGCDADVYVGNTLVSMYGKCRSCEDAHIVFDGLSVRDLVSWNVMLAAYVEQGQSEKALQLYAQMQQECITQNEVTLVCVLQACSNTGNLSMLRQLHHILLSSGNGLSPLLGNSLISAYGRCASKVDAQTAFNALSQPDVVSWNALIAAYARAGDCSASMQCYEKMQLKGVQPDKVTFLSLLSACSHAGLVDQGSEYFRSMSRDYGIPPEMEHYVSLADLFGRAGCFTRIEELVSTMPMQPNLEMLLCLLGSYQKHGEVALAEQIFRCAVELDPHHAASYALMSNIYTDAGLLDRAHELTQMRRKQVLWKKPGLSWIEHGLEVHTFVVQDRKHPQHKQLYELLTKAARPKQPTS